MTIKLTPARPAGAAPEGKQRVLDLAEAAFADMGFHGASLSAIARSAGLSNPGLLHHFPSKGALYLAVLERINRDFLARADTALQTTTIGAERLNTWIELQAQWAVDRPQAVRLVLRELIDSMGREASSHALPLTELVQNMAHEFASLQKQGALLPGPPIALVTQVLGTVAYALAVRPTFARMRLGVALLDDELSWTTAVANALSTSLAQATNSGITQQRVDAMASQTAVSVRGKRLRL
jgi:TetR/AcrR family transcriptional regulator